MKNQANHLIYFDKIADHDLLGRDGEIALAKRIEDEEIEVWRRILSFSPARATVLSTLDGAGIVLPNTTALERAASRYSKKREEKNKQALAIQAREAASFVRERDRDREHLAAVLLAIDEGAAKGRGRANWRRSIETANRAAAQTRQRFVQCNLRFVVTMSHKFRGHGVPMEDLIQEGNLGLIKGVDRFDYRRGYRFSTYAGWWIRHMMGRAVANASRTVRIPVHVQDMNQQISRAQRELSATLGREVTDQEIADLCQIPVERVSTTRSLVRASAISLDEPLADDGPTRLDLLTSPANDQESPFESIMHREDETHMKSLLRTLPPMQVDVLRKRFGLGGRSPLTLREIGEEYSLSRERIRQIQDKALQSLRATIEAEEDDSGKKAAAR
jgi:RNA polymerase primary sigma factor